MAHYALIHNGVVQQVITGVDETVTQTDTDGSIVGGSSEAWESFYASRPWFSAPCTNCSKLIHQAGIKRVVYATEYKDLSGVDFLQRAGVITEFLPPVAVS